MNDCLDHVIWACADLDYACRQFEALTGVKPRYGGTHAGGRSHNALVSLGLRTYLEILAPASAAGPDEGEWTQMARVSAEPRIVTYCVRPTRPLEEIAVIGASHGYQNLSISSGGRTRPDGVALHWRVLAPIVPSFGRAFPFFIDWLNSPHPGEWQNSTSTSVLGLHSFEVGHPRASALSLALGEMGCRIQVYTALAAEFRLEIDTARGPVFLGGSG